MSSFLRRTVVTLTAGAVLVPFVVLTGPVAANAATLPVIGSAAVMKAHPATFVRPLTVLGSGSQGFLYTTTTGPGYFKPTLYYRPYAGSPGSPVSLGFSLPGFDMAAAEGRPFLSGNFAYVPVFDAESSFVAVRKINVAGVPTTIESITLPSGFTYVGPAPTGIYVSGTDGNDVVQVYLWTKADQIAYDIAVANEVDPLPDPASRSPKFSAGVGITGVQVYGAKLLITYATEGATDGNNAHLVLVNTVAPLTVTQLVDDVASSEQILHPNLGPFGVVFGVDANQGQGSADQIRVFWDGGGDQLIDLMPDLANVRLALTANRLVWADGETATLTSGVVGATNSPLSLGLMSTGPLAVTVAGEVVTYATPDTTDLSIQAVNPANAVKSIREDIPFQPADTYGLDVSARRVVSAEASRDPAAYATRTFTVSAATGSATAGTDTVGEEPASYNSACSRLCFPVLTSGARTVRLIEDPEEGTRLLATNTGTTPRTHEATSDDILLSLSGADLLYRDWTDGSSVLRLLNVDTGASRVLTGSASATVGVGVLYEAPYGNLGTISTTNLATGAVTPLVLSTVCNVNVQSAVGSWLLYTCGLENRVYSSVKKASVPLPVDAEYRLGDGFVGLRYYTLADGMASSQFKVVDLSVFDPTYPGAGIHPVGSAYEPSQSDTASAWSVDRTVEQGLVYENSGHEIVTVPVNVPSAPVVLVTSTLPLSFTPNGDGLDDVWAPEVEVSKTATWSLTVLNSAGGLAYSQSPPNGTVGSFTWDGKTSGTLAADGSYSWTITATPADGVGTPVTKSGTVSLRTQSLAVTGMNLPAWFTPDGDANTDVFAPAVTTNLSASWAFTVTTATGVRVRTQTGGPGTTTLPTWDGRQDATSTVQPDGSYRWSLTLTDPTGFSPAVPLAGTVNLRARAVAVSARASRFSTDVATNGYSTISWSSAALPPYATGYNVSYRKVAISSTGRRTYGAVKPWLRNTTLKSRRLYVPAGAIYQVIVTVADGAPIRAAKPYAFATTASPIDDRYLAYGRGWSNKSSAGSYKGTLKYASVKGRTAIRAVYGSSFRLIGAKCKKCGSITVTVDGRNYAVSTYSSSTKVRQILFATTRSQGRHIIKVTVAGTKGRPGVYLDGIGVTA